MLSRLIGSAADWFRWSAIGVLGQLPGQGRVRSTCLVGGACAVGGLALRRCLAYRARCGCWHVSALFSLCGIRSFRFALLLWVGCTSFYFWPCSEMLTIYYILSLHFFGYPPPVYFFITIVVTDLSNVFSLPPHLTLPFLLLLSVVVLLLLSLSFLLLLLISLSLSLVVMGWNLSLSLSLTLRRSVCLLCVFSQAPHSAVSTWSYFCKIVSVSDVWVTLDVIISFCHSLPLLNCFFSRLLLRPNLTVMADWA